MAYLPSTHLAEWLSATVFGITADKVSGRYFALAAKLPASVIKAAHACVPVELLIAVMRVEGENVPVAAIRVYDEPSEPFTAGRGFLTAREADVFASSLLTEVRRMHFFDEQSRHVLSCDAALDAAVARRAHEMVVAHGGFVAVDFHTHEHALDFFEARIRQYAATADEKAPVWKSIPLKLTAPAVTEYYTASATDTHGPFRLDDPDEGGGLELSAHELLQNVYGASVHRSPIGQLGRKSRELTDLLACAWNHVAIVEGKALAILGREHVTGDRRGANVAKDIDKGLDQIVGAARFLRKGTITTESGEPIAIAPLALEIVHGIVLISEMHYGPDWDALTEEIRGIYRQSDVMAHIMDMTELATLLEASSSAGEMNELLIRRWQRVLEEGTALGRVRFVPRPKAAPPEHAKRTGPLP